MNYVTLETVANIAAILGKPESVVPARENDDAADGVRLRFCWTEVGEQSLAILTVKPQEGGGWMCSLAVNLAEGEDDPVSLPKLHEVIGWCVSNQARCLLDKGDNCQQAVTTVVAAQNEQRDASDTCGQMPANDSKP